LDEFLSKQSTEQIPIPRLFWTGYYANMNTILLLEVYFRREIVIEKDHGPTHLVTPLE